MKETTLAIEIIEDISFLETIKDDWNALLQKSDTKTIELNWEWQTTYWRHFNENAELFVLIIRESCIIVAIVPLKLTHTKKLGIDVRRLELIAAAESNYQDLIIGKNDADILTCVFDYLLKCSGPGICSICIMFQRHPRLRNSCVIGLWVTRCEKRQLLKNACSWK